VRRPAGTAAVLLAYLPHAKSDLLVEELNNALASIAYDRGKADPDLLKALEDRHPLRRVSAVVALCQNGKVKPPAALRKLLLDPVPEVRLRAALPLAQVGDAKAVSTLIALLPELPTTQAYEVHDFLTELADELAPRVWLGDDDAARQKARDTWARWWLGSEGPELLQELTRRTLPEADLTRAFMLIDNLGHDDFETRQKAEVDLMKMGSIIAPLLRKGLKRDDLEIRNRCKKCLETIEKDKPVPLSPVTLRLIALRKPRGAAEALLAYIPLADDEAIIVELQAALNMVAYSGGKAHPALVKALTDKVPARRGVAAEALCNGPMGEHLPRITHLLEDKDENVRLRVALALAGARESLAVPTLIALVGELPPEGSASAEEYLLKLARDNPPKDLPDGDDNRKKRSVAWDKWWNDNKTRDVMVDCFTSIIRERFHGYTLLVQANNNQIVEMDKDGKTPRWTITGLFKDAQVLPGNRVLVAEHGGRKVTERNLEGQVLWQKVVPSWPIRAERLKNGRTFIVCRNMLLLVDRGGRELLKIDRRLNDIQSARRLPNGQMVVITHQQILCLDRAGKEIKSTLIPNFINDQNEILDNGNVLVPYEGSNRIIEYNSDGKEVWKATVPRPVHAVRLPNGNTLVASRSVPFKIRELDRAGKQVNETLIGTPVYRVRRR
jgi:HEAT repeat protein